MSNARNLLRSLHRETCAQDAFDYLLTGGVVVVAMYLGFLGLKVLIPAVAGLACPVIDAATGSAVGACITP